MNPLTRNNKDVGKEGKENNSIRSWLQKVSLSSPICWPPEHDGSTKQQTKLELNSHFQNQKMSKIKRNGSTTFKQKITFMLIQEKALKLLNLHPRIMVSNMTDKKKKKRKTANSTT